MRMTALGLVLGLVFALPAQAAETEREEFAQLLQCAKAEGLYVGLSRAAAGQTTPDDLALLGRVEAVETRLQARTEALAKVIGEEAAGEVVEATKAEAQTMFDGLKNDPQAPRKILDRFKPVMESCVARGNALPAV